MLLKLNDNVLFASLIAVNLLLVTCTHILTLKVEILTCFATFILFMKGIMSLYTRSPKTTKNNSILIVKSLPH